MSLSHSESLDHSFLSTQFAHARKRLAQVKAERRRLLDVYQGGSIEKDEFESRASRVANRVAQLQGDLESLEQESKQANAGQSLSRRLGDFTSAIIHRLDALSFHERQALVRSVLEEVVIRDNVVKLYFKIPLPKPDPDPSGEPKPRTECPVSSQCDLRSRAGAQRPALIGWNTVGRLALPQVPRPGQSPLRAVRPSLGCTRLGHGGATRLASSRPRPTEHSSSREPCCTRAGYAQLPVVLNSPNYNPHNALPTGNPAFFCRGFLP